MTCGWSTRLEKIASQWKRESQRETDSRSADGANQPADGVLGVKEQSDRDVIECQLVRHRVGDERRYARRDFDQPARAFTREVSGTHVILGSAGIGRVILGFDSNLK
jgi:hypothetical protein